MNDELELVDYLAAGGKLTSPNNANSRYRGEIMRLMAVFVDSEMAGASGFADSINWAPGLKERMIAARMVLEKFAHAERVLKIMEEFGANTSRYVKHHPWAHRLDRDVDLGTRRVEGDMRLNVFHYPLADWCDAVTMNTLMGRATVIQLEELSACSYQPLADALSEIRPVEARHAYLGEAGLRQLLAEGHDRALAQASVDYWYPRVASTFGRAGSDHFEAYRRYGLRQRSNEDLFSAWQNEVGRVLTALGLTVPRAAGG
ncbi:MAG: Phenylacetic acid catabolic protein [Rhodospirillales bacterium]